MARVAAWGCFPLVGVALEGCCACGAEGHAAEAVAGYAPTLGR